MQLGGSLCNPGWGRPGELQPVAPRPRELREANPHLREATPPFERSNPHLREEIERRNPYFERCYRVLRDVTLFCEIPGSGAVVFRHLSTLLIAAYGWTDPAGPRAPMARPGTRMCAALLPPQQPALADGDVQHDGTVGKFPAWEMVLDHGVPQLPYCFLFLLCPGVKQTHKPQEADPFANHQRSHGGTRGRPKEAQNT